MGSGPKKSEHKKAVQTAQRALQLAREAKASGRAETVDDTWLVWAIGFGVATILAVGIGILGLYFALAIAINCAGAVLLLPAVLYYSRRQSRLRRAAISLAPLLVLGIFSWMGLRPAPIDVTAHSMPGGYARR